MDIGLTDLEVDTIFMYYDRNGDGDISCETTRGKPAFLALKTAPFFSDNNAFYLRCRR